MTDRTDTFVRADSTTALGTPSDGGSAWSAISGTWGIATNQGYKVASNATIEVAVLEASVSAAEVQFTVAATGSTVGGPIARLADDSNYLIAQWDGSGNWVLYKKVAGSYNTLATFFGTLAANDVFKLRCDGSDLITGSQNGNSRWSVTDSFGNTNTQFGFTTNNVGTGASGSFLFTTFSITGLAVVDGSLMGQSRQMYAMGLGA